MSFRQALRNVDGMREGFLDRQSPAGQFAAERLAIVIGHRNECLAARGRINLINGANIRMIERRGRSRFLDQPRSLPFVRIKMGPQKLDRDQAIEVYITGAIDDSHPAFAKNLLDVIVGDSLADHYARIISGESSVMAENSQSATGSTRGECVVSASQGPSQRALRCQPEPAPVRSGKSSFQDRTASGPRR